MIYISALFRTDGFIDWFSGDMGGQDEGIIISFTTYSLGGQRDALTELATRLNQYGVNWLRPTRNVLDKWLLNLDEVRANFGDIKDLVWARGLVTLIPEYEVREKHSSLKDGPTTFEGKVQFVITPKEMERAMGVIDFPELKSFLDSFWAEHQKPQKCGFLMMRFDNTRLHPQIVEVIRRTCSEHGIEALRADDKTYSDDLLSNIRTYMHGCAFGIALYERIVADDFNPNVSLEVGYMMALGKPVLLLKDKTLHFLHSDLVGRLYETFDVQSPQETIPPVLEKWLKSKAIIE